MATINGSLKAWSVNNGIALVLTGPSGKPRRFIVKDVDLRGELAKFLTDEGA
jgi:hypothetical protein